MERATANNVHPYKHVSVQAQIEPATDHQTWANRQIRDHSDTQLLYYSLEFSIYKLNAFGTHATENQKLFYLRVIVLYHNA